MMRNDGIIEPIDDPDLAALYRYWASKCRGRILPRRADIDPADLRSVLPHVFIAEIFRPLRFRLRLVGTTICERWGGDLTGKFLDELDFDGERAPILAQFASAAETGAPRLDVEEFVSDAGRYLHYRRILLPLAEDGHTPNMLLGSQKAIGIDGYRIPVPKWL